MPSASEDLYRGEAGQRYQQEKRAVPEVATPWIARLRAEKFQPFVKHTDTVVEIGVGLGWNLAHLKCARKIGTDLADYLPQPLKGGIEFLNDSAAIPDATADVVLCHHVLEHVEHPAVMLREAGRLLKPRGKLLLHVPYEKEKRYRHFNPAEPNHHLYSWNVQTLGNLLVSQGFKVETCSLSQFGYDRFAAKLALRFQLGETAFRAFRRFAHLIRPGREVRSIATQSSGRA